MRGQEPTRRGRHRGEFAYGPAKVIATGAGAGALLALAAWLLAFAGLRRDGGRRAS